ncbi:adenylosuccinate lyase [Nocardioides guangzhouensis]|uniref:Adenylosuccinate lyase n=1 Tax=Nocardioides guangzhouensis TaxID=2497878 RepID=A0A4Q4Z9Z2_9ACTN|nr:lyase family protein [Nocardioides guangzhouensis]RYP84031.1 adenylosuccinate lyase [Nocardioides guangzhouensis]
MSDLLRPGSHRADGVADDAALVQAMLRVEVAWLRALADGKAATEDQVEAVSRAAAGWTPALDPGDVEDAGNPVLPLVRALRARIDEADTADLVHAGLTSQDVLDTALVLLARDAVARVEADLRRAADRLADLADEHRGTVMAGRTLTQYAVPVTFGLKTAQWLTGVLDAADALAVVRRSLPVQCGGAAGTLARAADLTDRPTDVAEALAGHLGLAWPALPWHTRRTPMTRLADALVETCDALGVVATTVLTLTRPEIGEVREGAVAGRGASSTMPHKQNPVLSVLVRAAALQAPQLGAQVHVAAATAVDERPDGAWHAEWPSLRRLLELTVVTAAQAAELLAGLGVDTVAMARNADAAADLLLAERGGEGTLADYLGATDAFVDAALARVRGAGHDS